MSSICKIYVIRNNINDKLYIGQTWGNLRRRLSKHTLEKGCVKLHNAIKKYDKNNFIIKHIAISFNQKDADIIESYFIKKFNTIEEGYNIREGGSHGKFSEESKKKKRGRNNPMFGKHPSKETLEKRSKALSGKNHYNYGKHRSEETKEKLRKANIGNKHSEETKLKIAKASKGHKLSDESKKKISEGIKNTLRKKRFNKIKNKTIGKIRYCKRRNKYYAFVNTFNKRYCRYRKTKNEAIIALNELREELKKKYIKEEK